MLSELRLYRDNELAKLAALRGPKQRDRIRKLLRCRRLALLYAYEAVRRVHRLQAATPASIRALADRCNPFSPSHEPVQRLSVRKGMRDRFVQNFGPLKRMHQLLVADVLAKTHPPRPEQYLFNGGMPKALGAIEAAFRDGYTHAVEIDFVDFYGGVRLPGLAELLHPLPASVVENVVWDHTSRRGPSDDIAVPQSEGHPSLSGLVGLSLGAATSSVVGERIIGLLLDTAQPGEMVTYADNVLVLGRGAEDVEARAEHLREQASRLEAGPLRPRIGRVAGFRDRSGGVEFTKQWGQAIRHRLNWSPEGNKQAEHRIADITTRLTLEEIAEAERKVIQWRRSYPLWRTGDRWMNERLAELAAVRYYQAAQPEHLTAAQHAVIIAYLSVGSIADLRELVPEGSTRLHRARRMELLTGTERLLNMMMGVQAENEHAPS